MKKIELKPSFSDGRGEIIDLLEKEFDYKINITLTYEQLKNSGLWDDRLNSRTNFLGYLNNKKDIKKLFANNTILISTSIIETLGLHVIEAISNGILCIVPNEKYSISVYGSKILTYTLFQSNTLVKQIMNIYSLNNNCARSLRSVLRSF